MFRSSKRPSSPRKLRTWLNLSTLERREVPATFTVTHTGDVGAGSLRSAVINSNLTAGTDSIEFDASFNSAKTITLISGALSVTDGVAIKGPGSHLLTISGNDASRIFFVDPGVGKSQAFNLTGMTLTQGKGIGSQDGGAAAIVDATLIAIDVRFIDNAALNGGAVYFYGGTGGPANFRDCYFEGNAASAWGGAISGGREMTLLNCFATNNTAAGLGGFLSYSSNGENNLSVTSSTITNNSADTGGAINVLNGGDVVIIDSVFSGNSADNYGGGAAIHSLAQPGSLIVRNTTISNNTAVNGGGGLTYANYLSVFDTVRIENSTITANHGGTTGGGVLIDSDPSIESSIITGNSATAFADVDVAYDSNFATIKNSVVGNTAGVTIVNDGGNFLNMTPAQIKLGPLADNGGVRWSHALAADSPLLNKGSNPGSLNTDNRGSGFPRDVGGVDIGAYERNLTFVVTNNNDIGAGSLRQALADADTSAGTNDLVTFDPVFFATPRTILLGDEIEVEDGVEIQGPGAGNVTVTSSSSRALRLNSDGATDDTQNFAISGLTFADCKGSYGGALIGSFGQTTIRDCVFTNNHASIGGAIAVPVGSTFVIEDSSFTNNSASFVPFGNGGAIYVFGGLVVRNSTLSGNTAAGAGGAIFLGTSGYANPPFDAVIENSTLSGNKSSTIGGGIGISLGKGSLEIRNSTLTQNSAPEGGGIGRDNNTTSTIDIVSSIVSGNTAVANGADISSTGTVSVRKSAIGSAGGFTLTDLGGNLTYGTDLKLGPLAHNGGSTTTHAPQVGSPLINAGINTAGLLTDQRGSDRNFGTGVDIGSVEVGNPPRVSTFVVDDNTDQRSMVRSLTVAFDRIINLTPNSFDIVRLGPGNPTGSVALNVDNSGSTQDQTVAKITWAADPTFSQFTSLIDGRYRLVMVAGQITDGSGQQLDGDGNGIGGDPQVRTFHRLFGDVDGNALIDLLDFATFRTAYGTPSAIFSFDGDGPVDLLDFGQFRTRFGMEV